MEGLLSTGPTPSSFVTTLAGLTWPHQIGCIANGSSCILCLSDMTKEISGAGAKEQQHEDIAENSLFDEKKSSGRSLEDSKKDNKLASRHAAPGLEPQSQ